MPPNVLHTDAYVEECRAVVNELQSLGHSVTMEVIRGEELNEKGLRGLFGVGQVC
jgi:leucyl aminopeptidase